MYWPLLSFFSSLVLVFLYFGGDNVDTVSAESGFCDFHSVWTWTHVIEHTL